MRRTRLVLTAAAATAAIVALAQTAGLWLYFPERIVRLTESVMLQDRGTNPPVMLEYDVLLHGRKTGTGQLTFDRPLAPTVRVTPTNIVVDFPGEIQLP